MNWYYSLNNQQQGPVPEAEILRMAAAGILTPDSLVWREGMGGWEPLARALPHAAPNSLAAAATIGNYTVPAAQKDLYVQQLREGVQPTTPGSMRYAGFWMRFLARFIDNFALNFVTGIAFIPMFVVMATIGVEEKSTLSDSQAITMGVTGLISLVLAFVLVLLYEVVLTAKYGGTLGKMALGLKVVKTDGTMLKKGAATGRFFAYMVSSLTMGIGFIIAGFDDEKRSLHDHMCGTRVIYK